ncbi:MAG: TFIIH complex serine/threonine-protein kinase subunit kin28 [Candelina mexicana]|nr:MAG: TFIIH complex serine/threonine-protein kinase subunit kin28 [Candelina mexicana]
MAVSPLPPRPSSNINLTAIKAKALVVANKTNGAKTEARTNGGLAEQVNADEKQKWVKGKELGSGTYANVYKGHLKSDPQVLVAIKKIKINPEYKDGIALDAIREVKYLQELSHPNIITLHSVFSSKNQNLNLVLEYLPLGDLEMLIKDTDGVRYGSAEVKAWFGMLARAVWFCHKHFVLHRDIKPNNLLIAADGELKLADFGLARSFADPYRNMTHQVITRWYRPPELYFGARSYSGAVDVWSMACVFAELLIRRPFLSANTDVEQITYICKWVGTPTEQNWPGVSQLPEYIAPTEVFPVQGRDFYRSTFGQAGTEGVDLMMSMFALDPRKRKTAQQVLEHKYWASDPKPTKKEELPKKGGGDEKMGEDLKRRGGELEDGRADKVARKLDFASMK